jgi:hypothetical protein
MKTFKICTFILALALAVFAESGGWYSAPITSSGGGGFVSGGDSLTVEREIIVKGRTVTDSIVVGPCADDLSIDPWTMDDVNDCGKLWMTESAASAETLMVGTGWKGGSFFDGGHVILGNPSFGSEHGVNDYSGIHIEPLGGGIGLGVRNPSADLEAMASWYIWNVRAYYANDKPFDSDIFTRVDASTIAASWTVTDRNTSSTGSRNLHTKEVWRSNTDPNQGAQTVWRNKVRTAGTDRDIMWIDDEGHIVINGMASGGTTHTYRRTFDSNFPNQNRADSTLEVAGGAEIKGSLAVRQTITLINGVGAPTGTPTDGVVLFAADVSSSSELRVRDEAGNVTTLSANVGGFPTDMDVSAAYPYVTMQEQVYDGVRTYTAAHRVAELLQEWAWETGRLAPDKYLIKHIPIQTEPRP